jgi:hypothetical protein
MVKHALAARFAAGKVNAESGVISGVSLATIGPARGHDMHCDATTLEQLKKCAQQYQGGLKVKMTHAGNAGDILGYLTNLRIEGQQLRGDLHLLKSYEKRDYILELAETIPDTFGLSVSFSGPTEEKGGLTYARCAEIYSCDLVAEPAANPSGLFSAVDAGRNGNSPMTADEIKSIVQASVTAALSEFGVRVAAIETAVKALPASTELAALKTLVTELSTKLDTTKTELTASIGDEKSRMEMAAKTVALEFTRHTGRQGVQADGGGSNTNQAPAPADKFDGVLTKHFDATKSKSKAWSLAMSEDQAGYKAFLATGRKPAFEKAKA